MTDLDRPPDDAQRLLSASKRELERRSRDVRTLVRWNEQLEERVWMLTQWMERLLNSRRWKVGGLIGELGRRVLPKSGAPAEDQNRIWESFRAWQEEFDAQQRELRIRREEFAAGLEYLEPTKGRPGTIEAQERQTTADARPGPAAVPTARFGGAEYILRDLRTLGPVTIVVPVPSTAGELKGCLESVVRNTTAPAELLLIAAANADAAASSLLAAYEALENVRVLSGGEDLAFVEAVNRGFAESDGDVVVLDGNVEVAPRWLENLTLAAYADPRTATVTAVSEDVADEFSARGEIGAPTGPDKDGVGRLVMQRSGQIYPQAPARGGPCTYIKRTALDDVGPLDAENFPRGYGTMEDFCLRARKRGWNHVVDDTTFVFYRGLGNGAASETERETLERLHPEHERLARAFAFSEDAERVGENVRTTLGDAGKGEARPRVLFVLHGAGGGTPYTSRDLMDALADRYSSYVLVSDALRLKLFRHEPGEGPILVEDWHLGRKWRITEFSRPDFRAILFDLLVRYRFELIHIRHLFGHTFDLPQIADGLRIPVILSFHDFYLSCPTMHLIDDHGKHCGGVCTPGYGRCNLPKALTGEVPDLKHRWLYTWRENVERLLIGHADAFVTTSLAAKDVYLRSFSALSGRRFEVIEHGRDLKQDHLAEAPGDGPIRILMPGNITGIHKGAGFLRELKKADAEGRLELHFLGNVAENLRNLGIVHGPYQRQEFNGRVAKIRPSFIGIFSIWPETYCHTLTEAWAVGVPVLASDIGTLRERVEAHGGGWLLDHEDPRRSYERIVEIARDPVSYARELERANLRGIRSKGEMSDDYEDLYEGVLRERRSFSERAS